MAAVIAGGFGGDFAAWWGALTRAAEADSDSDEARELALAPFRPIQGVGPTVLASLVQFASAQANRDVVVALSKEMVFQEEPSPAWAGGAGSATAPGAGEGGGPSLEGKTVVFTGTLTRMKRSEAQSRAKHLGASVTSALSGKTSLLVVGRNAGGKLAQARELGVKVVSEEEWCKRWLGERHDPPP